MAAPVHPCFHNIDTSVDVISFIEEPRLIVKIPGCVQQRLESDNKLVRALPGQQEQTFILIWLTYIPVGSRQLRPALLYLLYGPGQLLDRFPVSPSPCSRAPACGGRRLRKQIVPAPNSSTTGGLDG